MLVDGDDHGEAAHMYALVLETYRETSLVGLALSPTCLAVHICQDRDDIDAHIGFPTHFACWIPLLLNTNYVGLRIICQSGSSPSPDSNSDVTVITSRPTAAELSSPEMSAPIAFRLLSTINLKPALRGSRGPPGLLQAVARVSRVSTDEGGVDLRVISWSRH